MNHKIEGFCSSLLHLSLGMESLNSRIIFRAFYKHQSHMCGLGQRGRYRDSLQAEWSEHRFLVGARFFAAYQYGLRPSRPPAKWLTGHSGRKRPGCGVDNKPHFQLGGERMSTAVRLLSFCAVVAGCSAKCTCTLPSTYLYLHFDFLVCLTNGFSVEHCQKSVN